MSSAASLLAFLLAGLLASPHCLLMCGPLVCGFCGVGRQDENQRVPLGNLAAYHAGRLWTYALLGLSAGWLGHRLSSNTLAPWQKGVAWAAGLSLIGAGIIRASNYRPRAVRLPARGDTGVELPFGLKPTAVSLMRSLSTTPGLLPRFLSGVAMGFLPCGIIYAMLLPAAALGSPLAGSVAMILFGMGTVPALNASGWLVGLIPRRKASVYRLMTPALLILAGCLVLRRVF